MKISLKYVFILLIIAVSLKAKDKNANQIQDAPKVKSYPKIIVNTLNNPEPGYMIMGCNVTDLGIMDNYGNSIDTVAFRKLDYGLDFQLQKNGNLTFFSSATSKFYELNNKYQIIDSFSVSSPYVNDFHDFILNPDRSYTMLAEDIRIVDMSKIVAGGKTNAEVVGFAILEYDKNRNLIWTWSTWDHFNILDATSDVILTENTIRYCHVNSIDKDIIDGNYIISNRHMDEVTKINRTNGQVMWRMGGDSCKNNQFTFIGDNFLGATGFSHQHDARRLPNGNLLLFDNGNNKPNPYSRAVEYRIDEVAKTATKVWEFLPPIEDPRVYMYAMCNVQRLPNGNTFMGFSERIYEVDKNNKITFYGTIDSNASAYRVFKNVYNMAGVNKNITKTGLNDFNETNNNTDVTLNIINYTNNGRLTVEKHNYKPVILPFDQFQPSRILNYRWVVSGELNTINANISINTQNLSGFNLTDTFAIYMRDGENNGKFIKLNSTYVSSTKTLEANITKKGEIVIANIKPLPVSAPFLKSPIKESLFKGDSLLKWSSTLGADKYRIQISKSIDFSTTIIDTLLPSITFAFSKYEFGVQYYWRVQAYNVEFDYYSPWSEIWNFRTAIRIPNPIEPTNNAIQQSYVSGKIRWNLVNYATNYALDIAEDSTFKNIFLSPPSLKDTSYLYQTLKPYTTYYWRVAAINGDGQTDWSKAFRFKTAISIPKLLTPSNKSTDMDVKGVLAYEKPIEAEYFQYQISKYFDFSSIEISGTTPRLQNSSYSKLASQTKYFWRVNAIHQKDTSDWSEIFQFTTQVIVPKLQLPANGAINELQNTTLVWDEINGAITYDIYLSETIDFNQSKSFSLATNELALSDLKPLQDYFWKIIANYTSGKSSWSAVWKFKTAPLATLGKPTLLLPNDLSKDLPNKVELTWSNVLNADKYRIQVSKSSNFRNFDLDSTTILTSNIILNLEKDSTYYWRVQAQSKDAISLWSEIRKFTVSGSSVLNYPVFLLPKELEVLHSNIVNFSWSKVAGATEYGFLISEDANFAKSDEYKAITDTFYLATLRYAIATYYWKLYSKNAGLQSQYSPVKSFSVDNYVSVDDDILQNTNYIYPSPVKSKLSINLDYNSENTQITVTNMIGMEIKRTNIYLQSNKLELDCTDLINGAYLLTISNSSILKSYYFVKD